MPDALTGLGILGLIDDFFWNELSFVPVSLSVLLLLLLTSIFRELLLISGLKVKSLKWSSYVTRFLLERSLPAFRCLRLLHRSVTELVVVESLKDFDDCIEVPAFFNQMVS